MQDFINHYSGSVCQAHYRISTLISTCNFRGWRNLFTPYMGHSYPHSFQGWLWQISSQLPPSQQLKQKKWAARAATDDTPTPHSGGQLICADDLNEYLGEHVFRQCNQTSILDSLMVCDVDILNHIYIQCDDFLVIGIINWIGTI